MKDGTNHLCIVCENRHGSTEQRLLNNEGDIDICAEHGASSFYAGGGHDSTE